MTAGKLLALIAAKVACCVLLVLAITGAMGGLLARFSAGPAAWAIAAALVFVLALTGYAVYRARRAPSQDGRAS